MSSYLITCTHLAEKHSHVSSANTVEWDSKAETWSGPRRLFKRSEIVEMIDSGDDFWSARPDGTKNIPVIVEKCSKDCNEHVIRSKNDDTTTNNLDYIPC